MYTGLIEKYRNRLGISKDTKIISLGEGNTPLIKLNNSIKDINKKIDV